VPAIESRISARLPPDLVLDVHGSRKQRKIVGFDTAHHVADRSLERQPEVDLLDDAPKIPWKSAEASSLVTISHACRNDEPATQAVGKEHDRIGQLGTLRAFRRAACRRRT
jgi:hypothetical protein